MTPELIERDWLSLRYWLQRCVLPSAIVLVMILIALRALSADRDDLNQSALIVGFFSVYFICVRGGHIIMIRALHFELLRNHERLYRKKLEGYSQNDMGRRNIGFMLTRIKRDVINGKR